MTRMKRASIERNVVERARSAIRCSSSRGSEGEMGVDVSLARGHCRRGGGCRSRGPPTSLIPCCSRDLKLSNSFRRDLVGKYEVTGGDGTIAIYLCLRPSISLCCHVTAPKCVVRSFRPATFPLSPTASLLLHCALDHAKL